MFVFFRGAVGDKFVFMDDNATCHRTLAVQDCLDSEGIQRLVWPARSPDLNPIENVWNALGRQVAGRNYPPTNKNTLIRALTEEWDKLPQQLLDNVVQSMYQPACVALQETILKSIIKIRARGYGYVRRDIDSNASLIGEGLPAMSPLPIQSYMEIRGVFKSVTRSHSSFHSEAWQRFKEPLQLSTDSTEESHL
ncbi:hypothetical protein TNCV_1684151 [Trichonephila clavipes]|nr:hypothetical protein TNCV_1684151 [Trichonephila clavipes]